MRSLSRVRRVITLAHPSVAFTDSVLMQIARRKGGGWSVGQRFHAVNVEPHHVFLPHVTISMEPFTKTQPLDSCLQDNILLCVCIACTKSSIQLYVLVFAFCNFELSLGLYK